MSNGTLVLEAVQTGEAGTYLCLPKVEGRQQDDVVLDANLVIASK